MFLLMSFLYVTTFFEKLYKMNKNYMKLDTSGNPGGFRPLYEYKTNILGWNNLQELNASLPQIFVIEVRMRNTLLNLIIEAYNLPIKWICDFVLRLPVYFVIFKDCWIRESPH